MLITKKTCTIIVLFYTLFNFLYAVNKFAADINISLLEASAYLPRGLLKRWELNFETHFYLISRMSIYGVFSHVSTKIREYENKIVIFFLRGWWVIN